MFVNYHAYLNSNKKLEILCLIFFRSSLQNENEKFQSQLAYERKRTEVK